MPLLERVSIRGFRAAREVQLEPGPLCALVGEAASGKSTVLEAIWMALDAAAPVPTLQDVTRGRRRIRIEVETGGRTIFLDTRPPETLNLNREGAPPVVFLPAALRASDIVAPTAGRGDAARAAKLLRRPDEPHGLVGAFERLCDDGLRGLVLLFEEPELFLSPQAQRSLYRLLRRLAHSGNQVLLSTHSPSLLRVDRLEEVVLVRRGQSGATELSQPQPLPEDDELRAIAEFDAERAELFLSRAALLVEGMTEKLALPLVFESLGYDADREAIVVLECGGKSNMPLFARICNECGIPYVVLHDRDAPRGEEPNESERLTNAVIRDVAGPDRTVVLVPDFERVVGVGARRAKPKRAVRRFENGGPVPKQLAEAVKRVVAAARG